MPADHEPIVCPGCGIWIEYWLGAIEAGNGELVHCGDSWHDEWWPEDVEHVQTAPEVDWT